MMLKFIKYLFTTTFAFVFFVVLGHTIFNNWHGKSVQISGNSLELLSMPKKSMCDVTVVTAYLDLGTFKKGRFGHFYTKSIYFKWANVFRYLKNALVVYTDCVSFRDHMMSLRNNSSEQTKVILINRTSLMAFKNIDKVRSLYSQEDYPKYPPGTTYPEYACTQHAKLDFLERSIHSNFFRTKYYMWLDIGCFRDRVSQKEFYLLKPRKFNESRIAMSLVKFNQSLKRHPNEVMRVPNALVGGSALFGKSDIILKFVNDFRRAVTYFLSQGLANTDQTVIYAMNTDIGKKTIKPEAEIQFYKPKMENDWFHLGHSMLKEVNDSDV